MMRRSCWLSDNQEVADLSSRAISLARHLDRLPPGEFTIDLTKRGQVWFVRLHGEEYGLAQLTIGKEKVDDELSTL